jgi:hypothetical protein
MSDRAHDYPKPEGTGALTGRTFGVYLLRLGISLRRVMYTNSWRLDCPDVVRNHTVIPFSS